MRSLPIEFGLPVRFSVETNAVSNTARDGHGLGFLVLDRGGVRRAVGVNRLRFAPAANARGANRRKTPSFWWFCAAQSIIGYESSEADDRSDQTAPAKDASSCLAGGQEKP
jgi:hypothetical protein